MKIIQLLNIPDTISSQGALLGLGDDGKVYDWYTLDGVSGWKLALDDVMYEPPEKVSNEATETPFLKTCPDCGKEAFNAVLRNTTTDLCECIPF